MKLVIPRGIVYHRVLQDVGSLIQSAFAPLNDQSKVEEFEKKFASYLGSKHCIAFPFARTAIYYALKSKNFPKGSEIIMPPISIKAILDVVLECGLKPVFVDLNPETICFDPEKLRQAITPNTKAALITYLFGIVPDMDEMMAVFREHRLFVMEDFSHCLNGRYGEKKIGTFGDVGIYSSSSIKTLDTYGGGLLVTDDPSLNEILKKDQLQLKPPHRIGLIKKIFTDLIRNVATTRLVFHFLTFPMLRFMSKSRPDKTIKHLGLRDTQMLKSLPAEWFTRYTSFQAKIGLQLISGVEPEDKTRIKNVELVKSLTKTTKLRFPVGVPNSRNVYWQLMTYVRDPLAAQLHLHKRRIDTSTTSLVNISNLPAYPFQGMTPNANFIHSNGLFIPAFPGVSEQEIHHIAQTFHHPGTESFL
jgi:dTDP-4-amino-4,6-dideoxygalactose transaminase